MRDYEHLEQVALFKWAEMSKHKVLAMMYAIPNGGKRHKRVAVKLKAEGVKSGVPDICLPVARGVFHGLYIELKKPKTESSRAGTPTQNQIEWQQQLNEQGYMAVTCVGWESAKDTIESYLAQ